LGALLSISDELWKFNQTGEFLVSNQHYFDYAKNQFPGSLDKVEFFSFRIFELYQEPFISERTSASFLPNCLQEHFMITNGDLLALIFLGPINLAL
jgi:hypothetical protein